MVGKDRVKARVVRVLVKDTSKFLTMSDRGEHRSSSFF